MKSVGRYLDPRKFTIVPHVAIVDEFEMAGDDGSFVATIDKDWIAQCVERMNTRESTTGDLAPCVIGHTFGEPGENTTPEIAQPPVTAFARNWVQDEFFDTGRTAAFADIWVFNEDVERVKKFPRRSGEVWVNKHEIDPISFLGATTPARDLGLMLLNRGGDVVIQRETKMPDEKKDDKNPESSGMKGLEALMQQVLAAVTSLTEKMGGAAEPKGEPGAGDDMSDEDFEKLLAQSEPQGGDDMDSRKKEPPPEKQSGEQEKEKVMLARIAQLESKVAESDVKGELLKLARQNYLVDPEDAALVADLVAMPPEMRKRAIERVKLHRKDGTKGSYNVDSALATATDGEKKRMTPAESQKIMKLAREKGVRYETEAAAHGFILE